MTEKNILFIDDDRVLLQLLSEHFMQLGFRVLQASTGIEGLQLVASDQPDIVVLDVMMPGMNGLEVCKQIRKESNIPIVLLSAKGEEVDKLHGFHLGVDDYVTKPFSFAELVARVNAILNRIQNEIEEPKSVKSGDLVVDFDQHTVSAGGIFFDLTPTEYRLLEILVKYINRTVPTEMLLREVWGPEYAGETDHVKHFIWSLRQKIEADPGDPQHIITERGFGYRFH